MYIKKISFILHINKKILNIHKKVLHINRKIFDINKHFYPKSTLYGCNSKKKKGSIFAKIQSVADINKIRYTFIWFIKSDDKFIFCYFKLSQRNLLFSADKSRV